MEKSQASSPIRTSYPTKSTPHPPLPQPSRTKGLLSCTRCYSKELNFPHPYGSLASSSSNSSIIAGFKHAMISAQSQVRALLTSQVQVVLATISADLSPHTALMAYSTSEDLKNIYLTTLLASRKAENMIKRPNVSLLFDNRTGNLKDHGDGLLVTSSGIASLASSSKHRQSASRS